MKTIIKIFYWAVGTIVLLLLISLILPKTYKVERVVYIRSNPNVIYALTSNFDLWHTWTAWTKESDSTVSFMVTGEPAKVGTSMKWDGEILGHGEMVLTELIPGQLTGYDLSFDAGKYRSKGKIVIESQGDSSKVSWLDEGDLGYNPINRYMGLFMDRMMGPDFEKGLAKLKTVAELRNDWPRIEEVIIPAQNVVMVLDSAGPKEYGAIMGKAYSELYGFISANKLVQKGAPFATYTRWDPVTLFSVMNICIPVESAEKGRGRIQIQSVPQHKAVRAIYFGSYSKMEPAYIALATYIKDAGKVETGGPSEIYITSPLLEKDTLKWETHIVFPVK